MEYPTPFNSYILLERIGTGGMSRVELARRSVGEGSFIRFLAIKRITADNASDQSFVRMFQDEARINAELHHQNIAEVYDFGQEDQEFFLAMEYIPGLDLRHIQKRLRAQGLGMSVRVALTVLCQILEALHYAHTAVDTVGQPMNVIHRDVNPRNVMLSVSGEVKLIDFGVARAEDRLERTEGRILKGKFTYMAPEQVEGTPIDHRVDLYAVGMMFHELMTGHNPLSGLDQVQIIHRILMGDLGEMDVPPEYPDPERLQAIRSKALARNPADRYLDAEAFRRDLEAAARLAGGLCRRKELAAFLKAVEPQAVDDIYSRLEAYRALPDEELSKSASVRAPAPLTREIPTGEVESGTIATPPPPQITPRQIVSAIVGGLFLASLVLGAALIYIAKTMAPPQGLQPTPPPDHAPAEVEPAQQDPGAPAEIDPTLQGPPDPGAGLPAEAQADPTDPGQVAPVETVENPPVQRDPTPPSDPIRAPGGESTAGDPPSTQDAISQAPPEDPASDPAEDLVETELSHRWGYLFVTSRPKGLAVLIDGRDSGATTPLKLHKIDVGRYQIQVRGSDGALSEAQQVRIREKENTVVTFEVSE